MNIGIGMILLKRPIYADSLIQLTFIFCTGTVWPQPVSMKTTSDVFSVAVQQFAISPSSDYHTCDLLIGL